MLSKDCRNSLLLAAAFAASCLATFPAAADDRLPDGARHGPDAALAARLKQAFDEGLVAGSQHLRAAQKHIDQARKAAPGDPRVEYTAGLVLLKQLQVKPAQARFEAALKLDSGYWPARQAVIWGKLTEKQLEPGLKQLAEFAAAVQDAESEDEISEAQRDAARWIGQLFEAVSATAESKTARDEVAAHEERLLKTFGDELAESFESGREALRERVFEFEQQAGLAQTVASRNAERRKQDKADKLAKGIDGLGKAKEEAAKTAEEWKQWLDDTIARADKQLGLLERDYKFLDQRLGSLSQSIVLMSQQITALDAALSNRQQQQNSIYMQNAQWQLMLSQNQMFSYQLDYNATLGRMSGIAEQGALVARQRADAIKRYETETGQLAKKEADLDKWSDRLKNQKQKLAVHKPNARAGKKAGKKQHLSLKTLFPLDFGRERDLLLSSLAPAAVGDDKPGE